jgi:CHAD domain-containing protein
MQIHSFLVNNKENNQIIKMMGRVCSVKKAVPKSVKRIYYDTFDLCLQKKGLIFYKTGTNYVLQPINIENNVKPITFKFSRQLKFWQDFPTSDLKNKFSPLLGVRALIAFASLKSDLQFCSIVDSEEKIVAKVSFENFSLDNSGVFLGKVLTLIPIKGYNKHYNKLFDMFAEQKWIRSLKQKDFIQLIVEAGGIIPVKYSAKPASIDESQMSSEEAAKKILCSLIGVIKINEDGVVKDIDTEFLHDFRVAIRRTRSILSLLKIVFNEDAVLSYKLGFASLAGSTNKLRDYDVYLLNKDSYQQILPPHLHRGLNQFFINIKKRKKYEHKKLVQRLNSSSYREFITSWEEFLENDSDIFNSINSTVPIVDLARKHIYGRFKKILKKGGKINKESPDSNIHDLRLDCKKLRYLVEFFSGLFPGEDITALISQLKKLQDCLGEFNDYSIQQIHLEDYLLTVNASASSSIELAATIGALITASYQEKQKRRNAFFKIFRTFAGIKNINLYIKLFKDL